MDNPTNSSTSKRILLIEDEEFIRYLYKRQLDLAGLPTDAFEHGQEGIEALKNNKYDLILLDVMLPDTNGLQVYKEIKQIESAKDTPVVFLTNMGQEDVIREGMALGAKAYLIKASYTPDQIVEKVKSYVGA